MITISAAPSSRSVWMRARSERRASARSGRPRHLVAVDSVLPGHSVPSGDPAAPAGPVVPTGRATRPAWRARPAAPGEPPLRLTRRGRVLVVAFLLAVALALLTALFRDVSAATSKAGRPPHYRTVVVEQGQSLWDIARAVAPGTDPRVTVRQIVDINALSGVTVQPGQELAIPPAR